MSTPRIPKMQNTLELPAWHPLPVYNKKLTPEEWYIEIWKRFHLEKDMKICSDHNLKLKLFETVVVKNEHIPDIMSSIRPRLAQPIKPLSVFEVLYMAELIKASIWYGNFPHKNDLEEIVKALSLGKELNDNQFATSRDYADIPWHIIYGDNKEIRRKLPYTHGSPVTINSGYHTDDVITTTRNYLSEWRDGKQAPPSLSNEIYNDWIEKKILEIFDLSMWCALNNIEYTKMQLAATLWPDHKPAPLSRRKIEKKGKKPVDELIDYLDQAIAVSKKTIQQSTLMSLQNCCESRKFQMENNN